MKKSSVYSVQSSTGSMYLWPRFEQSFDLMLLITEKRSDYIACVPFKAMLSVMPLPEACPDEMFSRWGIAPQSGMSMPSGDHMLDRKSVV